MIACEPSQIAAAWPEIDRMQDAMNERFSWFCERLCLEPVIETRHARGDDDGSPPVAAVARGFTKVGGNDWEAVLVVHFLLWLSRRIPDAYVDVVDEGDLLLANPMGLRAGVPRLNERSIRARCDALRSAGNPQTFEDFEQLVAALKQGRILRAVPAVDYADLSEIKALGLDQETLARMTLEELAARMPFPWLSDPRTTGQT